MSLFSAILILIVVNTSVAIQTLWPIPSEYTNGSETITLCDYKNIQIHNNLPSSPIITNATQRFISYLQNAPQSFTIKPVSKIKRKQLKPSISCLSNIDIRIDSSNETLSIETNENYTLIINSSLITIHSGSVYGTVYALVTLSQLIRYNTQYSANIISNSPWHINDSPAFKYRGLMIDTGRNWLSVALIKKTLFAMALNKMNVLHWHMIDAQAFPFYSNSHPELSQYGSYGKNKTYFPNDIKEIVSCAKNLAIRVIPEWESPGHDTSIGFSDPELMTCDSLADNHGGISYEPPCGYLNILNQSTKPKVIELFNDLSKDSFEAFPDNAYHIGGDEVLPQCFGNQTNDIYSDWMQNRVAFLKENGKVPLMWSSEQSLTADYGQKESDVMMITYRCGNSYNCQNDKYTALKSGFKVVDADSHFYYLDCGLSNWLNPMANTWCGPYRTWGVIYNHSLYDNIPTNESGLYKNLLGGELCQWGETVDSYNFESRVWIRSAAAAERWWKNMALTKENANDILLRLQIQRYWMLYQGIASSPLSPEYCLFNNEYCEAHRSLSLEYTHLLEQYSLTKFTDVFEMEGWTMVKYWKEISVDMLKEWGFKSGDLVKFKHLIHDLVK